MYVFVRVCWCASVGGIDFYNNNTRRQHIWGTWFPLMVCTVRRPHVAALKYFHFFRFNIFISRYLFTHTCTLIHTKFWLPLLPLLLAAVPARSICHCRVFLFAFVKERKQRNTCIQSDTHIPSHTYVHMFAFCVYTDCLIMSVKPLDLQFESSARHSTFIEIINSMETVHIRLFICYCSCTLSVTYVCLCMSVYYFQLRSNNR